MHRLAPLPFLPFRPILLSLLAAIALWPSDARGYELRRAPSGTPLIWGTWRATVSIDAREVKGAPAASDAIRAAFATWAASGAPVTVTLREAEHELGRGEQDDRSTVTWLRDEWEHGDGVVALTLATYYVDSSLVFETDIVIDAAQRRWSTGAAVAGLFDVQTVLTHEVGHFFGLGHSTSTEATMHAQSAPGETAKRVLSADDRLGLGAVIAEMQARLGSHPPAPKPSDEVRRQASTSPLPTRQTMGCQIVEARLTSAWWLAWPFLLWLVTRRRARSCLRRLLPTVAGLAVLLAAAASQATIVRPLSFEQLTVRADVIVEGRVIADRARRVGRLIVTDYTLEAKGCWKGRCARRRVLRLLGGELDGIGLHVAGVPRLRRGQHVVLFARDRAGRLTALGLSQGLYLVQAGSASRDLRALSLLGSDGVPRAGTLQRTPASALRAALLQARLRWRARDVSTP